MSSSFRERGDRPEARQEAPGKAPSSASPPEAFPNWLDRMHTVRARHDAITRNLNTWSNYKSWAERMRNTWGEEQDSQDSQSTRPSGGGGQPPNH